MAIPGSAIEREIRNRDAVEPGQTESQIEVLDDLAGILILEGQQRDTVREYPVVTLMFLAEKLIERSGAGRDETGGVGGYGAGRGFNGSPDNWKCVAAQWDTSRQDELMQRVMATGKGDERHIKR